MSLLRFWLKKTAENHFFRNFYKESNFFLTDVFLIGRAADNTAVIIYKNTCYQFC